MTAVLTLAGATKRYGERTALDAIDLQVQPGEVLALLGPNGAGKSTLVALAAGISTPDAGTVRVAGDDPRRRRRRLRRTLGLAPQDIGLYPSLTVRQNLEIFGEVQGVRRADARRRADALLAPFALEPLAGRRVVELSGGEQRRVHTAAALVHGPALVLLDEPTAGADPRTRQGILDAVRGVAAEGTAVVYTTHYLQEVEQLGAHVALLEAGRIIASGSVPEIIARHAEPALVLGFDGEPPAGLTALTGAVPLAPGPAGARLQLTTPDPAAQLRTLLAELGERSAALAAVEIVQPSLEAAYLHLTGRLAATSAAEEAR